VRSTVLYTATVAISELTTKWRRMRGRFRRGLAISKLMAPGNLWPLRTVSVDSAGPPGRGAADRYIEPAEGALLLMATRMWWKLVDTLIMRTFEGVWLSAFASSSSRASAFFLKHPAHAPFDQGRCLLLVQAIGFVGHPV